MISWVFCFFASFLVSLFCFLCFCILICLFICLFVCLLVCLWTDLSVCRSVSTEAAKPVFRMIVSFKINLCGSAVYQLLRG